MICNHGSAKCLVNNYKLSIEFKGLHGLLAHFVYVFSSLNIKLKLKMVDVELLLFSRRQRLRRDMGCLGYHTAPCLMKMTVG